MKLFDIDKLLRNISGEIKEDLDYSGNVAKAEARDKSVENFNAIRRGVRMAKGASYTPVNADVKSAARRFIDATLGLAKALRGFDSSYNPLPQGKKRDNFLSRAEGYGKELDAAKAAGVNLGFLGTKAALLKKISENPSGFYSDSGNDSLVKDLLDVTKKAAAHNGIDNLKGVEDDLAKALQTNTHDVAQLNAIKGRLRLADQGNEKAKAETKADFDRLDREADAADRKRADLDAGKEPEARADSNAKKRDLSAEELKLKYGSGKNSATAAAAEKAGLKSWADLDTGFKTNYALIQSWKSQGIKPDPKHMFYRVGNINGGDPVMYLDGSFFTANRNWWSGTHAKLTSIRYSEPDYTSDNPPEEVKEKWLELKKKIPSTVTESIFRY